jgi:hypothetical protein
MITENIYKKKKKLKLLLLVSFITS